MSAKKFKSGIISFSMCLIILSLASINAQAVEKQLIPLGGTVGISLSSEGVVVVGIPDKMRDEGDESPAKAAGIRAGDIIKEIDSKKIESKEDVKEVTKSLDGSPVSIEVLRNKQPHKLTLTPYKCEDGTFELGVWMRDGIAGIGTMTFYDPQTGLFGALGHSISDSESGVIVPLKDGIIAKASVQDVIKGKPGVPGQLSGDFDFSDVLGKVTCNAGCGIFGILEQADLAKGKEPIPIAAADEIRTGPAGILANVSGSDIREYKIEISRVYTGAEAADRNMMITVTDPALIEKTGGIVQGMSGSPIIQDGKLVGAITHVLINDPARGFAVSVEKMLNAALEGVDRKAAA
ncbi:MAG: SpoIVB peptidase [Oscillospiraceae bacterium]|nr:SpoIVB peptidase [Oscillospiraceae bacterium]